MAGEMVSAGLNKLKKRKFEGKKGMANLIEKSKKPILIIGGEKFKVIPGSENAYSILDKADVEVIEKKASGGRVGLKSGMRVCKLATKGKGRAYGKNS